MKSKAHGKRCPEGTTPGPVLSEPDTEEGGVCKTTIFQNIIAEPIKESKKKKS